MNQFKRLALTGLTALVMGFGAVKGLEARTLRVPSEYSTIQSAVNAAVDGDEVLVAQGSYQEEIMIRDKSLALKSEQGNQFTTINSNSDYTINIISDEREYLNNTIEGFTIRGVHGIQNNTRNSRTLIKNNKLIDVIDGIAINSPSSVIEITSNYIEPRDGYGIGCRGGYINVKNNIFRFNNYAVSIDEYSEGEFTNNSLITYIRIPEHHTDKFIYANYGTSLQVSNNIFFHSDIHNMGLFSEYVNNNGCNNIYGAIDITQLRSNIQPTDIFLDPLFCDPLNSNYLLQSNSPCVPENNSCNALIGALGAGCESTPAKKMTWGELKTRYR